MFRRFAPATLLAISTVTAADPSTPPIDPAELVVHEWGTFTSVASEEGEPIEWWTLGGPQDLPCFVSRFPSSPKVSLGGTVRMETPVLYFYAPREMSVDVEVRFKQGLITEWYPRAAIEPAPLGQASLRSPGFTHQLKWSGVDIRPGAPEKFPTEAAKNHYYAARATDAAPIVARGQAEKFLFYRGVGRMDVPVSVVLTSLGSAEIRHLDAGPLAAAVLFDRQGDTIRYRIARHVTTGTTIPAPTETGTIDDLGRQLQHLLVAEGLFEKEAAAMIATWRDSWFEEGTRLFYIVPPAAVEEVLPLTISPAPARLARVFVGRVEMLTARGQRELAQAIERDTPETVAKYGRFLPTMLDRLLPVDRSPEEARGRADNVLARAYSTFARANVGCAAGRAAAR